jgi:phosphatidate cytidylyltransferase
MAVWSKATPTTSTQPPKHVAESGGLNLLKRVGTAVVLIPIVLILVLRAPVPVLAIVAGVIALLATAEFLKLSQAYEVRPIRKPTYVYIALFFVLLAINPGHDKPLLSTAIMLYGTGFAAVLAPFVFLSIGMRRYVLRDAFLAAAVSTTAFTYIAVPLGMLVQLREQWAGALFVLYVLLVVWAGDIFAYFVGRSVGRHLMSPRVSPKKTWEGALASVAASVIVGALLFGHARQVSQFFLDLHLIQARDGMFGSQNPTLTPIIILSVLVNIAAQLGDLVESLIKRGAGVKDSGALLPGHGGMLDRIDALLFAAPVVWFYASWRVLQ